MSTVAQSLAAWKSSQCHALEVGGLFSRSKVAHKWKAPFRSLSLRECVSWRTQDLLEQSLCLYEQEHILGARILLRSAFETLAVLIYLNQQTRQVLAGKLNFHDYSDKTAVLLLGSRDGSTQHKALNIVTILEKCNSRYFGISELYGALSESAHPNYEGTSVGYSNIDHEMHAVAFLNKWKAMYSKSHIDSIILCIKVFFLEYNEEWSDAFEKLEAWIEANDTNLEATKRDA